jgi:hypothetical protein
MYMRFYSAQSDERHKTNLHIDLLTRVFSNVIMVSFVQLISMCGRTEKSNFEKA